DLKQLFKMDGEDSTFGFIEELKEPLIGKEENLEPLGRSSEDSSSGWVSQVIRAPTRKSPNQSVAFIGSLERSAKRIKKPTLRRQYQ
ncbi:hypothetical protein CUMW_251930, partial [Citrus unshiu]